jgi:hypothetical protein
MAADSSYIENYDKTNFLHFRTKHSGILDIKLQYNNKSIDTKLDTQFLGIIMDSALHSVIANATLCCMLGLKNPTVDRVTTSVR